MEFHHLTYTLKATDPQVTSEWFPSYRAAAIRRMELFRAKELKGPRNSHPIVAVDVPAARKADLLAWLNRECV